MVFFLKTGNCIIGIAKQRRWMLETEAEMQISTRLGSILMLRQHVDDAATSMAAVAPEKANVNMVDDLKRKIRWTF